jgi:arsenate reductase
MKIVFLCVANSARSQMAEALARSILGPGLEVTSAGSMPSTVNPLAIEALKEIGIDHVSAFSKNVSEIDLSGTDFVITLCADEVCPILPVSLHKLQKLHWPFEDPAATTGSHEEKLASFRSVRDAIASKIQSWKPELLTQKKPEEVAEF